MGVRNTLVIFPHIMMKIYDQKIMFNIFLGDNGENYTNSNILL